MNKAIQNNAFFLVPLVLSLLFFLRKGIQYAMMNRYLPLCILVVLLLLLLLGIQRSERAFFRLSKIWAILLIFWSIARLFISIVSQVTNTFDEYHLNHQFGLYGVGLSMGMLVIGVMIFRNAKKTEKAKSIIN
ncbi:MAG: hypothetical protein AAFV95_18160 [Bacteroidota bacterium]